MNPDKMSSVSWMTGGTARSCWEAEFIQQMLVVYDIPSHVIDIGVGICCGQGSQAALQVRSSDQWKALLLLNSPEED